VVKVEYYAKEATTALNRARQNALRDDTQATYNDAALVYGSRIDAQPFFQEARAVAERLQISHPKLKDQIDALMKRANAAVTSMATAINEIDTTVLPALPRDPPIDGISHSVKFVIAMSASVSPNWVLVNFRGPTAGGTFASGTYSRTHTLSISMGSPGEQARQLNNLVIIQSLGRTTP
jgi:hypothetical protein